MRRGEALVLGLLTAVALAVRVAGIDQSLFGDELFTYADLSGRSLGEVVHHVGYGAVEDNPPLFYVLAGLAARLGDPAVWLRLPSVVLGAATVPLVHLAGRLAAGRAAGLCGAALYALSPFVAYYGTEARAYATMAFFVALSTVALLCALRSGRRGWWALYALAECAALYSHYTAIFAVAAQALWTLLVHRRAARPLLSATAAAALAYLPWIPSLLEQGRDSSAAVIGAFYPVTPRSVGEGLVRQLCCHPYVRPRDLPGELALGLLGLGALVLAYGAARRWSRPPPEIGLPAVVAVATPAGLLLYSAVGTGIFAPRNLSASIPAVCLVVGWLLTRAAPPLGLAAGALIGGALVTGLVMSVLPANQRPDYRGAARFIDARAHPRDAYLESHLFFSSAPELREGLKLNFRRRHPAFATRSLRRSGAGFEAVADDRAWLSVTRGRRLYVVGPQLPGVLGLPVPPRSLARQVRRVQTRRFPGIFEVQVVVYGPR